MDAVLRYDFSTRRSAGHGLKAVARHLGIAAPRSRVHSAAIRSTRTYRRDPERVRRYAAADVEEVAALARMLGGAAFALAQMAPRRYERLADAGAATGVIDPLLVRAYLRAGQALPAHERRRRHAAQRRGAAPVRHRRRPARREGRRRQPVSVADARVPHRAGARHARRAARARRSARRAAARGEGQRASRAAGLRRALHARGDVGGDEARRQLGLRLSRGRRRPDAVRRRARRERGDAPRPRDARPDVPRARRARRHAARGRHRRRVLRGARVVDAKPTSGASCREVAALLPPLVQLEFDGRYAAMLSHEPKNYALLELRRHAAPAGRRVPLEPRRAVRRGVPAPRDRRACSPATSPACATPTSTTVDALRRRELPTHDVSSRVRLTKTPERYLRGRDTRRELTYEALLASGRTTLERRRAGARLSHDRRGQEAWCPRPRTVRARRRGERPARLRRRSLRPRAQGELRRAVVARAASRAFRRDRRRPRAAVAVRRDARVRRAVLTPSGEAFRSPGGASASSSADPPTRPRPS